MTVQITKINVDNNILDQQQQILVESKEMVRYFGLPEDFIQLYVYSNTDTLLRSNTNFQDYSVTENKEINFDPENDIQKAGFQLGTYKMVYNFLRPTITLNSNLDLFVKSISNDRTEIKISTTTDNDVFYSNAITYINTIQSRPYFIEFYLDFGNNKLIAASSLAAEKDVNGNATIIIKLFDALPQEILVNSPLNVVEEIVNTQSFSAILTSNVRNEDTLPTLRQANFSIEVDDKRIGSSDYYNYDQIINATGSNSEFQSIMTFISSSNPTINVDYSDYSQFVHFSSISQRLATFRNKLIKIEAYKNNIVFFPQSPDVILYQSKIDNIIKSFDNYENYLYTESSSFAWPKINNEKPYNLYSYTSSEASLWYSTASYSASYYDEFNNDNLVYGLPVYLQEREDFQYVKPFVHSMGQMFDDIWIYIKAMTDLWKSKNKLTDGISKDLVADALQSLGIKLYTDGDQDDLYTYLYGLNSEGTYTFQTSSLQTGITASQYTLSGQDEAKSVFKRIYHNLPVLLKSKGTNKFINYLATLYGVPDTILFPMEYGGVDKESSTYEFDYSKFTYALQSGVQRYVFVENNTSLPYGYNTLELRFKPQPSNNETQTLFTGNSHSGSGTPNWGVSIQPTTIDGYNYANVTLVIKNPVQKYVSASVSLPIYVTGSDGDYNWWNLAVTNEGTGSVLYVKSELNGEIGFQASVKHPLSIYDNALTKLELGNVDPIWGTTVDFSLFGNGKYYGQIQELRGWTEVLKEEVINTHTLNPESYIGNTTSSAYDNLIFRFPLGNDLKIEDNSIILQVEGVQPTTNTQLFLQFSGQWQVEDYKPFTEQYYTKPAIGGYSTPVTNKIRISNDQLASNKLETFKSVVYNPTSSRTIDTHLTQTGFSPQDQINNDIIAQLGDLYNLDDIIGDPRTAGDSNYQGLETLRNDYFEKYVSSYNYKDFITLIETFHKSLFRYLADYVPGRTNNATGVVIKPHILERSKVKRYEPNVSTSSYYTTQISTVSITGSNPGDYCCSRNSPLNEAFYTGEISGSTIQMDSYYNQHNPYVIFSEQEGTISYPGFDLHVNDNWNLYLPSPGTYELEIYAVHLGEELYITDLTSLASLGGLNMGPSGVYNLTITTTGVGIEFSNQGLWGMGYVSIDYVKAVKKSSLPKFSAQYAGFDALNNNLNSSLTSKFKFREVVQPTFVNPENICGNCQRWEIAIGADPSSGTAPGFEYTNCTTGTSATSTPGWNTYSSIYSCGQPRSWTPSVTTVTFRGEGPPQFLRSSSYFENPEWQDSLITDTSYLLSREIGVKTTSPDFNQNMTIGSSIGSIPNVDYTTPYILFYDWASNSLAEKSGSGNYHIKYLIDESGSILKPEYSSSYWYILNQGFEADLPVNVTLYNTTGSSTARETTVYRPLKQFVPIMYSDTGSQGSNLLYNGYFTTMSFTTTAENLVNGWDSLFQRSGDIQLVANNSRNGELVLPFNEEIKNSSGNWNTANYTFTALGTGRYQASVTASAQLWLEPGSNDDECTITLRLYKNGIEIAYNENLITSRGSADGKRVTIETNTDINKNDVLQIRLGYNSGGNFVDLRWSDDNGTFQINTSTNLNSSLDVYSPYFLNTSGSTQRLILSTQFNPFYGSYRQDNYVSGSTLNSGFSDPDTLGFRQFDQIRFEGNEDKVRLIMSSSYEQVGPGFRHIIWLNDPINVNETNINYFVIRRLVDDPGFIILNDVGTGPGFIIPKYLSPTIKEQLPQIIENLSSKGLIP